MNDQEAMDDLEAMDQGIQDTQEIMLASLMTHKPQQFGAAGPSTFGSKSTLTNRNAKL